MSTILTVTTYIVGLSSPATRGQKFRYNQRFIRHSSKLLRTLTANIWLLEKLKLSPSSTGTLLICCSKYVNDITNRGLMLIQVFSVSTSAMLLTMATMDAVNLLFKIK